MFRCILSHRRRVNVPPGNAYREPSMSMLLYYQSSISTVEPQSQLQIPIFYRSATRVDGSHEVLHGSHRLKRKSLDRNDNQAVHLGTGHHGGAILRSAWLSLLYLNLLPSH